MQIFDEIKMRDVEHILFLSMDGVSDPEEGAKEFFPNGLLVHRAFDLQFYQICVKQRLSAVTAN